MAAVDEFTGRNTSFPATGGQAVVNDVDLAKVSRAIWVGVAGDVEVLMADGTDLTFKNMVVGWHPMRITRVKAALTTATQIIAVW